MTVIEFPQPPVDGIKVESLNGGKVWVYNAVDEPSRPGAVGRWALVLEINVDGGGDGTSAVPYRFDNGTAIVATTGDSTVIGGDVIKPVHHDLSFDSLKKLEEL